MEVMQKQNEVWHCLADATTYPLGKYVTLMVSPIFPIHTSASTVASNI